MGSKGAEREEAKRGEALSSTSLRQSSSDISSQLAELDKEIREFRQQNQMLERLRQEVEAERHQLELEKESLSEHLRDAEQRFERYKEAELKKMKKDRKDIDKQLQLAQAQVADLRGERDSMRKEMQVLQEDAARRERKLKAEVERVKKKMEEANSRNDELVRELKFSEEARVALQDREQLASLKARVKDRRDRDARTHSLSLPPPSPRSQDSLATLIATSAVTVEAGDTRRDAQLSSLLAGVQRAGGTDERKNESEYISAPSGYVSGSCIQSSACVSLHLVPSRLLDTSATESRWQARERESGRREQDDSVHSAMNSFQVYPKFSCFTHVYLLC
jgi:predicted  nucleic acid-binding Zn-ribbon protein